MIFPSEAEINLISHSSRRKASPPKLLPKSHSLRKIIRRRCKKLRNSQNRMYFYLKKRLMKLQYRRRARLWRKYRSQPTLLTLLMKNLSAKANSQCQNILKRENSQQTKLKRNTLCCKS